MNWLKPTNIFSQGQGFGTGPSPAYKWIVLACASLAISQGALNMSAVIIALPDISRDFHLSVANAIWVITIFPLIVTALASSLGRVSDIYGREKVFTLGLLLFLIALVLAGVAQNGGQLIGARALLGAAYAVSWANSAALVTDAFPASERGRALAISQSGAIAGQMVGLAFGGLLTDLISWRAIFLMSLPISALTAVLALFYLREVSVRLPNQTIDLLGAVTWTAGIGLVLLGLNYITRAEWTALQTHFSFLAAAGFLLAFLFIEFRVRQPVIDFTLFKDKVFTSANVAMLANTIAISVIPLMIGTFYFRGLKHYSPLEAGVAVLPASAVFLIFGPLGGYLADRAGTKLPALVGLVVAVLGLVWLAFLDGQSSYPVVISAMCVAQIGSALFVGPNTMAI
ncbi:MAG TPA: MFS transporter, partial [Dehalococcoidia bacterium]|nr:MFS transporter [Dehalococcoidia bacterium]